MAYFTFNRCFDSNFDNSVLLTYAADFNYYMCSLNTSERCIYIFYNLTRSVGDVPALTGFAKKSKGTQ